MSEWIFRIVVILVFVGVATCAGWMDSQHQVEYKYTVTFKDGLVWNYTRTINTWDQSPQDEGKEGCVSLSGEKRCDIKYIKWKKL